MSYPSISQHLEWCGAAGYAADTTIADRRELLQRVVSEIGPLNNATGEQLAAWLAHPGWSSQTRATYFGHLAGYYRWARRFGHIGANPMDLLDRPRVPKRSPRPVADAIYRRIWSSDAPRKWRLAAALAARNGYRACEIARASREQIDEDWLVITGKGGRMDVLPTHVDVWLMVKDLPPGHLILDERGRPYMPSALSSRFSTAMKRIGLPGVTLHPLRHTYATYLSLEEDEGGAGANLRATQKLCRHQSLATTEIYTAVTDRQLRLAISKLPTAA
jgi:integrase/recombinase XerD